MKTKRAMACTLLLLSTLLIGCSGSAGGEGEGASVDKMLYVSQMQEPSSLDPTTQTEYYAVPLNIYDRLYEAVTVDGKPELVPGLADSYDVSDDGLVYTFHLHEGVKYHNGEAFEADDVVYTVNRMMDPANSTVNTDFFSMIKGAMDVYEGNASEVVGVKALDPLTVEITLEYPFGAFIANLATPPASIFNREAGEAAGAKFGVEAASTVGTGPFKVVEWKKNDKIVLETYQEYFKGASALDGVTIKIIPEEETNRMAFENKELDILDGNYAQSQLPYFLESETWRDNIVRGPEAGLYFWKFNMAMEPYNDINVRLAIAHAIDKQAILDSLFNGNGQTVDCLVVEGVLGHNESFPTIEYDQEKARQYLANAGYPDGGLKLELIMANPNQSENDMNIALQGMLKEVGIELELKVIEEAAFTAMQSEGKVPFERYSWWVDYNDPDNFLYTFFARKNIVVNSTNYADEETLQLLESARRETDEDTRLQMYQQAELNIVNRDVVIIPVLQANHVFILQDNISNFTMAWNGWSDMSYYGVEKN